MTITRTTSDGICLLTFDRPESSANIFDFATLNELDAHVAALENEAGLKGVILMSAKPKIFIAGADLHALAQNTDEAALADIIDLGHRVFTRLGQLAIPSVAAIHGVCLGGGLEVALACDWRVASTDKATKLGLPETQLGILPAWGGSTRLPKLIGLSAALGLILTGKQIVGAQALKLGLVDDVTHVEYLSNVARNLVTRGKRRPLRRSLLSRAPLSSLVAHRARRDVLAKTRGHYPALLVAIDVCTHAVGKSPAKGFAREKSAFLQLIHTPGCRNLMGVFFLQERAKKLPVRRSPELVEGARGQHVEQGEGGTAPALQGPGQAEKGEGEPAVRRTAVIGAGTMGAGIAQWISARGYPVLLKDVTPDALARGLNQIEGLFASAVKRHAFTQPEATAGLDRIVPVHTDVPLKGVDLVIEAAVEQLDLKQQVFRDLETRVGPDTVLATNTSALSIDAIASVLTRPERVVGMHFFNPVHRMQLIEIVHGPRTSPQALATALQFAKAIGKLPVIAKDSPGFIVNRILLPYLVEAVNLFGEGMAIETIDKLMLDFGMPMGPLRLCDEVGLDVAQHVAKDLERRLPVSVPVYDTLEKMIARGWLGKKSGCGFYRHDPKGETPNPQAKSLQHAGALSTPMGAPRHARGLEPVDAETKLDRMVLVMINEAARVLHERVVEAPEDIDFAMIMGTGWAPFRGGPLHHADALGLDLVLTRLETLSHDVATYFSPCELIRGLAREKQKFYPR
ncbi:MAG TPA: 3-hydroxyacyl-CoA dehydrogenase NAD-binding domain-containing protein [Opitutaceae bacterium]|nr:3-hydroxyacyl-CoA dehydrogenase NAD-binding domain-containing protein [Opitutaceae bacterium]